MASLCRRHIAPSKFKLQHERPTDFVLSVVCESPIPYAVAVTCVSIHTVTMAIYSGFSSVYGEKILIWLTYWSFFSLTARFLVTTLNAWVYVFRQRAGHPPCHKGQCPPAAQEHTPHELPTLYKVQWALQNVSSCSALMVSALYWTIMYNPGKVESERSINSHSLNAIFVLADLLLSRAPVRIQHFVYAFLFVSVYVLFSLVYWAAGGLNHLGEDFIYPLLNYSDRPGRAALVVLGVELVVTPGLQVLLYALFRLRQWARARCASRQPGTEAPAPTAAAVHASDSSLKVDTDKDADKRISRGYDICLDEATAADGCHQEFRGRNYTLTSGSEDGDAVVDVSLDFEMDELRAFRPSLQTNTSQVSCTESTKALLS